MTDINWLLLLPFIIIQIMLAISAIIDWVKVKSTNGPRIMWLFIILIVNIIGPILYFIFGRKD
ncbi:MAG TPA: PLDc N-terminal domain-containing protein [Pseudogracilibacillus sp.]|nr:PLDc N-terminal domain-containing protein [Pseudogracilibacillus sp.]